MNTIDTIESNQDIVTFVQVTDTHLFSDEKGSLLGVNTLDSFAAVVQDITKHVESKQFEYQALIMTGDVSQDHTDESYQRFNQGIQTLGKNCYWLPGNHDYKPSMNSIYPSAQIKSSTHVLAGKFWQVVLLDSQVEGCPHGELSKEQLNYLDQALSDYPDRYTLILLHHHPRLVGSEWLDKHCLHNSDEFWQVIAPYSKAKAVLCGHVHQDFNQLYNGVRVITSPSTCIQFKPNSNEFALDRVAPGWRSLALLPSGEIETQIYRLDGEDFLPDFDAEGY
ncbi:3',5'-cyclic-AMP phosphodiesterase [Vibrio sp. S17_S38]|uniref:3',5'-cyclic-AMP phosphodiesterase n=1 Tax=Vibrio sp. S17_S38 TaxID=2720229 RepID=UPI0016804E14|nr:3',5'-cyclic-AMP phosphodiesterase [Vibrio sp. S17_S38]MBD1574206.1 3',5'-cyclic-AMP phosphodiesterase [Vibrio sp. S17_S38]